MDVAETLARLGEELSKCLVELAYGQEQLDGAARDRIRHRVRSLRAEVERLKEQTLGALLDLLTRHGAMPVPERVAAITETFVSGAKAAHALSDAIGDVHGYAEILAATEALAAALDVGAPAGRAALAPLLGHPDARVRATAGACLLQRMPERALPVLRAVEREESATAAHFTAYWARIGWELAQP